ncbi:hypothetical protein WJX82_002764 [Trebouxia sp. C0006]
MRSTDAWFWDNILKATERPRLVGRISSKVYPGVVTLACGRDLQVTRMLHCYSTTQGNPRKADTTAVSATTNTVRVAGHHAKAPV